MVGMSATQHRRERKSLQKDPAQVWVWGWWASVVQLREHMPKVLPDSNNGIRGQKQKLVINGF